MYIVHGYDINNVPYILIGRCVTPTGVILVVNFIGYHIKRITYQDLNSCFIIKCQEWRMYSISGYPVGTMLCQDDKLSYVGKVVPVYNII